MASELPRYRALVSQYSMARFDGLAIRRSVEARYDANAYPGTVNEEATASKGFVYSHDSAASAPSRARVPVHLFCHQLLDG